MSPTADCRLQAPAAGNYSCLLMELTLRREFSYYMLTIYVPTCMLVIVSWYPVIAHISPG